VGCHLPLAINRTGEIRRKQVMIRDDPLKTKPALAQKPGIIKYKLRGDYPVFDQLLAAINILKDQKTAPAG
jgi:hypothetical protein